MANSKIPAVLLNDTLNLQRRRFNQLLDSVGDVSTLKTTAGGVTAAVNELYDSIGVIGLGSLNTTAQTLRQAINEHETDLGNMSFTGLSATDVSAAVRELRTELGDHSALTTATTISAIAAINEHDAELGTITAGAMGTTASTVSNAIAELDGRLDSINETELLSLRATLSDSSATNIVKGNLQVDTDLHVGGNTNIDGNLDVNGTADLDATNVDGDLDVTGLFTTITTDGLTEGDNLYYTTSRADSDFDVRLVTKSTTNLAEGNNLYYTTSRADSDFDTRLATKSTTNLTEGDNLYYTTIRADSDFDVRLVTKSTTNLAEGSNLYYTTIRADSDFDVRLATKSTTNLTEGNNLYYTTARADSDFDVRLVTKSTTNLTEGSNLYYTSARADSDFDVRLVTKSTTNLAEGNNLYYTTARADSDAKNAVSANDAGGDGSFTYNNATGVFTYTGPSAGDVRAHITAGEGIDFSSGVISGEDATTSNKGIASFATADFNVSSGAVSLVDSVSTRVFTAIDYFEDGSGRIRWNEVSSYWEATDSTGNYYQITVAGPSSGGIRFLDDDDDILFVTAATGDGVLKIDGDTSVQTNLSGSTLTISVDDATISTKGIASFDSDNFAVSSGAVSIKDATVSIKVIASFSSDNFAVSSGAVSIKDNGITLGTETTGNYVATIAGTANEITVSGSGSETASVTVGLPNDVTVGNNLTVTNDFTVGGSFTVAGEQRIAAQYIFLQDGTTGTPSLNSGVTVDRGSEDSAVFQWNETSDYWEAGTKNSLNRLALQDDSANFTSLSVNNDLVVSGNLDVRGTTTTIDTTNLTIEDNLIILNGNQTGTPSTTLRSGLEIERGDASNAKFQFNENTDEWEFTGPKTGTLAVTGDIGNATITLTAGTDLSTGGNFTTNQSGNETITINHADITRTNTTTTASPAYGASFTAIDTLTTNARGHVTGANTKTVTLPAAYSHPTHPGDSASIDTGALTGATVISDLDLNITTDNLGHVTDANAAVATRTLTLADLGYTGATDANNYSLPLATDTVRGGIELFNNTDQSVAANSVTTTAGRTYGLQLNSANQAVMNVPWTDTVYSHPSHDGDDISIDTGPLTGATVISDLDFNVTTNGLGHVTDANGTVATRTLTLADLGYTGATDANNYSLPEATSTVRGGIELFSNTDQSVAANAVTTTAGRTYGLQLNSDGQGVINVPWTGAEPVNTIDSDSVTLLQTLDNPNVYDTTANDYFGRVVAAGGKYLAVAAPLEDTASFSNAGVVYVYNILNGSLLNIIQNPNPGAATQFGGGYYEAQGELRALDISGNWLIAGSSLYDSDGTSNTGKAYIFNIMTGALHKTLDNPNGYSTATNDNFGGTVAIDGYYAAVSAIGEDDATGTSSGKVYIFNTVTGALLHTLDNPNTDNNTTLNNMFGMGLSLSGKYLLIGAPGTVNLPGGVTQSDAGKAYIYNVITGALIATIQNPNAYSTAAGDEFGWDASIDGNYAAIGAIREDLGISTSVGRVYIFKTTDGTWSDVSLLHDVKNPGTAPFENDLFGRSVSISGDYGIFTAYLDDDDGVSASGRAYIYNLTTGGLVSTVVNPNAYGTAEEDRFGFSATISGNYAAVGAYTEDDSDGTSSGKVYTYSLVDPTSTSYVTYAELNNLG